jgi:hypothetical protein
MTNSQDDDGVDYADMDPYSDYKPIKNGKEKTSMNQSPKSDNQHSPDEGITLYNILYDIIYIIFKVRQIQHFNQYSDQRGRHRLIRHEEKKKEENGHRPATIFYLNLTRLDNDSSKSYIMTHYSL